MLQLLTELSKRTEVHRIFLAVAPVLIQVSVALVRLIQVLRGVRQCPEACEFDLEAAHFVLVSLGDAYADDCAFQDRVGHYKALNELLTVKVRRSARARSKERVSAEELRLGELVHTDIPEHLLVESSGLSVFWDSNGFSTGRSDRLDFHNLDEIRLFLIIMI